jgi:hypothetical protein
LNALIWRKLTIEVVHLGAIKMSIKGGKFLKQQILNMGKVKSYPHNRLWRPVGM